MADTRERPGAVNLATEVDLNLSIGSGRLKVIPRHANNAKRTHADLELPVPVS